MEGVTRGGGGRAGSVVWCRRVSTGRVGGIGGILEESPHIACSTLLLLYVRQPAERQRLSLGASPLVAAWTSAPKALR